MTKDVRYYLERYSTLSEEEQAKQGSYSDNRPGKLKFDPFNMNQKVTDGSPTYYEDEEESKQIATALNLYAKIFKFPYYIDVQKEEVKTTKITDNDPRPKPSHDVEVNTEKATASPGTDNSSNKQEVQVEG